MVIKVHVNQRKNGAVLTLVEVCVCVCACLKNSQIFA